MTGRSTARRWARRLIQIVCGFGLSAALAAQVLDTQQVIANSSGGGCTGTAGSCAVFQVGSSPSMTLQTTGTFSGTLTFEATSDGANWVTVALTDLSLTTSAIVTTTTTTGRYAFSNQGALQLRARATAWASGTAFVTATRGVSSAPAAAASGGGGGGSGTVTSVSVTTANGVSGSVATATTTPAISLTLGAITPTTVNGQTVTAGAGTLTLGSVTLNAGAGGTLGSAAFTNTSAYEVPLTFSTGLTRSTNTITVNTSQNIATLSNLTTNGIVTTSGAAGTLGVTAPGTGVLTALGVNVGSAGAVVVNGGALGTPSSGTATNLTGLPIGSGVSGLGTGIATWLATPTSANLISAVTDETGTGALVFGTNATLVAPTLGAATATSLNGNAFTTGTYTLTGAASKTLTFSNSLTLAGTDSTTMTFPSTSATVARTDAGNTFTGNQVITEAAGGSGLTLTGATQTSSVPVLSATQTWNASGTTFAGSKINITNTASASGSQVLAIQFSGTTKYEIATQATSSPLINATVYGGSATDFVTMGVGYGATSPAIEFSTSASSLGRQIRLIGGGTPSVGVGSAGVFAFYNGTTNGGAIDLTLVRDAADTLAQRRATNPQALRLYNTWTDASNGEWLTANWASNLLHIGATKNGTGTARVLSVDYGGTTTSAISVPITSGLVTFGGPLATGGSAPSVANVGANSCGTTAASIAGNDANGEITVGATAGTQCRVTFTTTAANRRDCVFEDESTKITIQPTYVDTTHTDVLGVFTAGDVISYICMAR